MEELKDEFSFLRLSLPHSILNHSEETPNDPDYERLLYSDEILD